MSDPMGYEDIGTEMEDAGWRFVEATEDELGMVTARYSRYVDGKHVKVLSSTQPSGSLARLAAIREMREATFPDTAE